MWLSNSDSARLVVQLTGIRQKYPELLRAAAVQPQALKFGHSTHPLVGMDAEVPSHIRLPRFRKVRQLLRRWQARTLEALRLVRWNRRFVDEVPQLLKRNHAMVTFVQLSAGLSFCCGTAAARRVSCVVRSSSTIVQKQKFVLAYGPAAICQDLQCCAACIPQDIHVVPANGRYSQPLANGPGCTPQPGGSTRKPSAASRCARAPTPRRSGGRRPA